MSTKQKLPPRMWDRKKQIVVTNKSKVQWYLENGYGSELHLRSIQHNLNKLRAEVDNFLLGQPDGDSKLILLKGYLQNFLNPDIVQQVDRSILTDYVDQIIREMQSGYRKKSDGKSFTKSTIECYQTFRQVLKMYERDSKVILKWKDVGKKFYLHFIQWNEKRGVSINYTGRLIKDLKTIIRIAHEEGIHSNDEYRKRYFSVPKEKRKKVPLSLDEIYRLYNLDVQEPAGLIIARDIFVFGCFVGLRISDIKRIGPEHVNQDSDGHYIEIRTQKTGTDVKIPLNGIAFGILQKYDCSFPVYSEQSLNRNIKILGHLLGFDSARVKSLSLHHSRHTFARLAYQQGVPSMYIMRVTGHQSEKSFLRYINPIYAL